jgi:hypothetical protein
VFFLGSTLYTLDIKNNHYIIVSGSESISFSIVKYPDENLMIVSDVSKNFSYSRLKRVAVNENIDKIDHLIITGGFDADVLLLTAKLRQIFTLDSVDYYGERDQIMEEIFLKSFPGYYIDNFTDGEDVVRTDRMSVKFSLLGRLVDIDVDGKNIGVFSSFEKGVPDYTIVDKNYSLLVLLDNGEQINDRLKPIKAVYYRTGIGRIDAERSGNLTFLLG